MNCCKHNQKYEEPEDTQAGGTVYTCPMHPEIVEEQQGMCPECGMALVPSKKTSKNANDVESKHNGHSDNVFKKKFWWSLILTIPILLYSSLARDIVGITLPAFPGSDLIGPVLGSIVFFYGGWIFLKSSWTEIRGKLPGMMTLISLAIVTAYIYSISVVILGREETTLFWELASLITIMLLGHWFEMRAVQGAKGALKELSNLLPDTATVIRDGKDKEISVSELEEGDTVLVKPGGKIPADGTIVAGSSSANESIITGESKPVEKSEGDEVIAGTINGDGSLKVRVDKIGEQTFLSGVMRLVREAEASKSRLQVLSDRAALYLTGIAISVGVATFISWLLVGAGVSTAITRLVAVLIIACPHALGLAIPLVASISTTKAAQNGLLVKKRLALEAAREIDIILFDKTGTLTKGEFGVDAIIPAEDFNKEQLLTLSASVNSHSEHPIAKAIVNEAQSKNLEIQTIENYKRIPGKGAQAKIGNDIVLVGSNRLLSDKNLELSEENKKNLARLEKEGKTINHVIIGDKYAGSFALVDIIREESKDAIAKIKNAGIRTAMVTGDSDNVAQWVSKELDIDQYYAQILPDKKTQIVKELQEKGTRVAMVGDGVNDAPALTQADLGIAVGAGTNVAIESAGIILVKDNPQDITKIFTLSRLTYKKMVQNLWWAAGYNIIAIPLAAGVLAWAGITLEPAVGAILMSASTVIVAFNALLLKRQSL